MAKWQKSVKVVDFCGFLMQNVGYWGKEGRPHLSGKKEKIRKNPDGVLKTTEKTNFENKEKKQDYQKCRDFIDFQEHLKRNLKI